MALAFSPLTARQPEFQGFLPTIMSSTTGDPACPRGFASGLSSLFLSLACVGGSDSGAVRAVGLNISKHVAETVLHRSTPKSNHPLGNAPRTSRVIHESTCRLPYEIVEMIITYLTRDLDALKACALTCHSWYTTASAHIHRTLLLKEESPEVFRCKLEPLSKLHKLGLTPLVKEVRIRQWRYNWFLPQAFDPSNFHHFAALSNVQTLRIHALDIDRFTRNIEHYFGRLFPTVQSIALHWPTCTPRQLSFFLSLFSNLDDIEVWWDDSEFPLDQPNTTPPATFIPPARKPRGRLILHEFQNFDGWKDLIVSCGGLQFRYIELYKVGSCAPILSEASAETLETFRFYFDRGPVGKPFSVGSRSMDSN